MIFISNAGSYVNSYNVRSLRPTTLLKCNTFRYLSVLAMFLVEIGIFYKVKMDIILFQPTLILCGDGKRIKNSMKNYITILF